MHKYRLVSKKGEGTFSEVLKAQSVVTGEYFAVKCMKNHFKSIDQVNSLREIQALRRLNPHEGIIQLEEVLYDSDSGRLALVFELMDKNIYEMIRGRKQYVNKALVKDLMFQLIKAVAHMHNNGIFHRDIKPENILVHNAGSGEPSKVELKVADFGSCRGIYTKQPFTEYISTRWYRAPECLLTNGFYDYKMDMWGIGCVMFEIVSLFPLFPGTNELDQIDKVHAILGTPSREVLETFKKHSHISTFNFPPQEGSGISRLLPHAEPECVDLIKLLLQYNPETRITAFKALKHAYFKDVRESENGRARTASPKVVKVVGEMPEIPDVAMKEKNKHKGKNADKKLPLIKKKKNKRRDKQIKKQTNTGEDSDNDVTGEFVSMDSDDMASMDGEEEELDAVSNSSGLIKKKIGGNNTQAITSSVPEETVMVGGEKGALPISLVPPKQGKLKNPKPKAQKKVQNFNASTSNLPSIVCGTLNITGYSKTKNKNKKIVINQNSGVPSGNPQDGRADGKKTKRNQAKSTTGAAFPLTTGRRR